MQELLLKEVPDAKVLEPKPGVPLEIWSAYICLPTAVDSAQALEQLQKIELVDESCR